jgi:metacaspase-1
MTKETAMRKFFILPIIAILVLFFTIPVNAAPPPDKYPAVHATNVEIVQKVTLKGAAPKGAPKISTGAATGILGTKLTDSSQKYAVVIGINNYPGTSSDLNYCVPDATLMADVLQSQYKFLTENVKILTDDNATRINIFDAIKSVRSNIHPNDEFFFFFSGHGAKGKAADYDKISIDQSIVVWNDAKNNFDFIWDGELKQEFDGFPTNRVIFAFDSCLSGGMSVLQTGGRVVCMGSTINTMSLESPEWGHGQFTYYFVQKGMQNYLADNYKTEGVGVITVEEAFDYAKANCKNQTPTIADGFTNDLLP